MNNKLNMLEKIADEIRRCKLCQRWGEGKAVPGEGNPDAEIVFIGEAPGSEEAKTGRPFIGRSGRFLRQMIRSIGLKDEEVFITSPAQYRPVRGRPTKENIIHSRTHLLKQLSIIDPKIIVLLGSTACLALLERNVEISKEHGRTINKGDRVFFITFHPAYAMRFARKDFEEDFKRLKGLIGVIRG
ncbi:MAG: uracil-DNA glycosylase [Thermodesulfovibrionales bacterium]